MMKSLKKDDQGLMFDLLVGAGLAIILFFAIMNIGTYINSTIGSSLVSNYADNTPTSVNTTTFNNRTGQTTEYSTSITLPDQISIFNNSASKFYIFANGSSLSYDLNVNGQMVIAGKNITSGASAAGANVTFTTLLTNSSVNVTDTVINYQWNITGDDGTGQVFIRYSGDYYASGDYRTVLENSSFNTLVGLSEDYDDTLDALTVAAIVMAITLPLAAVVAIRKFF